MANQTIKDQNGKTCRIGDLVEVLISPYGVRKIVAIYDTQELHQDRLVWVKVAELDHISYREGKKIVPVRRHSIEFKKSKEKTTRCMSYCFCQRGN